MQQRFKKRKNGASIARKANKRVKTIAGKICRDLESKLMPERLVVHNATIELYKKALAQKRGDSGKIYSLHEPEVKCYAKGKEHKKFEFGSKVSIAICQATGIIVGALNFTETLHDSKTIPAVLEQVKELINDNPKEAFADRGYVGKTSHEETKIYTPKPNPSITEEQRKKHSKRAAVEPKIGHLKSDHRLNKNYLKGVVGDCINAILAAATMNFKRVMNLWKKEAILSWKLIYNFILNAYWNFIAKKSKIDFLRVD